MNQHAPRFRPPPEERAPRSCATLLPPYDSVRPRRGALLLFANPEGLRQARRLEQRCEACGCWSGLFCPFGRFPDHCLVHAKHVALQGAGPPA